MWLDIIRSLYYDCLVRYDRKLQEVEEAQNITFNTQSYNYNITNHIPITHQHHSHHFHHHYHHNYHCQNLLNLHIHHPCSTQGNNN